jgi:hypothetical protein
MSQKIIRSSLKNLHKTVDEAKETERYNSFTFYL